MHSVVIDILLAFQAFHVLFLALHDWVPLGRLNNVGALRRLESKRHILLGTLITTAIFAFGLAASVMHHVPTLPAWVLWYLWISYAFLFVGELEAWWGPYLGKPQPARAERYQALFAGTQALLPERNGIPLNTLHLVLHLTTVATLLTLAIVTFR